MYQHWNSKVVIMQERPEPLPRCDQCGMNMPKKRILKHRHTDKRNEATERRIRRRDMDMAARYGNMEFSMKEEE